MSMPAAGLPRARRASGDSMPWSTALRTRWVKGSLTASSTERSSSVSPPSSVSVTSLPNCFARSLTTRGCFDHSWSTGCMRVFITSSCSSLTMRLSRCRVRPPSASSPEWEMSWLRASTSSPTWRMRVSSRSTSTRTVRSAAAKLARASAGGVGALVVGGCAGSAAGGATAAAGGAGAADGGAGTAADGAASGRLGVPAGATAAAGDGAAGSERSAVAAGLVAAGAGDGDGAGAACAAVSWAGAAFGWGPDAGGAFSVRAGSPGACSELSRSSSSLRSRPSSSSPAASMRANSALIVSTTSNSTVVREVSSCSTPSRSLLSRFSALWATDSRRPKPRKPVVPLIVCTARKMLLRSSREDGSFFEAHEVPVELVEVLGALYKELSHHLVHRVVGFAHDLPPWRVPRRTWLSGQGGLYALQPIRSARWCWT